MSAGKSTKKALTRKQRLQAEQEAQEHEESSNADEDTIEERKPARSRRTRK